MNANPITTTATAAAAAESVQAQLEEAIEAEQAAKTAIGEAQLQAVTGGAAVPGSLVKALEAASQRRAQLEAAAEAAARAMSAIATASQVTAREIRQAEIASTLGDALEAAREITAALARFKATSAGERCVQAVERLIPLTRDMSSNVLTPFGWAVADGVMNLRALHRNGVPDSAGRAMAQLMRNEEPDALLRFVEGLQRELLKDVDKQPADWPGPSNRPTGR